MMSAPTPALNIPTIRHDEKGVERVLASLNMTRSELEKHTAHMRSFLSTSDGASNKTRNAPGSDAPPKKRRAIDPSGSEVVNPSSSQQPRRVLPPKAMPVYSDPNMFYSSPGKPTPPAIPLHTKPTSAAASNAVAGPSSLPLSNRPQHVIASSSHSHRQYPPLPSSSPIHRNGPSINIHPAPSDPHTPYRPQLSRFDSPTPPTSSPSGMPNDDLPFPKPTGTRSLDKPPYSYAAMIGQAILASRDRRLSLNHIYNYITLYWPFYKPDGEGWRNSIRHNLSLNHQFCKLERGMGDPGKGCLWAIKEEDLECFANGNFVRNPGSNFRKRTHDLDAEAGSQQTTTAKRPRVQRARAPKEKAPPKERIPVKPALAYPTTRPPMKTNLKPVAPTSLPNPHYAVLQYPPSSEGDAPSSMRSSSPAITHLHPHFPMYAAPIRAAGKPPLRVGHPHSHPYPMSAQPPMQPYYLQPQVHSRPVYYMPSTVGTAKSNAKSTGQSTVTATPRQTAPLPRRADQTSSNMTSSSPMPPSSPLPPSSLPGSPSDYPLEVDDDLTDEELDAARLLAELEKLPLHPSTLPAQALALPLPVTPNQRPTTPAEESPEPEKHSLPPSPLFTDDEHEGDGGSEGSDSDGSDSVVELQPSTELAARFATSKKGMKREASMSALSESPEATNPPPSAVEPSQMRTPDKAETQLGVAPVDSNTTSRESSTEEESPTSMFLEYRKTTHPASPTTESQQARVLAKARRTSTSTAQELLYSVLESNANETPTPVTPTSEGAVHPHVGWKQNAPTDLLLNPVKAPLTPSPFMRPITPSPRKGASASKMKGPFITPPPKIKGKGKASIKYYQGDSETSSPSSSAEKRRDAAALHELFGLSPICTPITRHALQTSPNTEAEANHKRLFPPSPFRTPGSGSRSSAAGYHDALDPGSQFLDELARMEESPRTPIGGGGGIYGAGLLYQSPGMPSPSPAAAWRMF